MLGHPAEPRSVDGVPSAMSDSPERAAERRISVVDDDPSVRDSLGVLLQALGFDVSTYDSGSQFLADDRRRNTGCLIIDQHMPGMDGLTVLAALRRDGEHLPAILITGRSDDLMAARAAALGVTAVLEKPFSVPRLVELVRAGMDPAS